MQAISTTPTFGGIWFFMRLFSVIGAVSVGIVSAYAMEQSKGWVALEFSGIFALFTMFYWASRKRLNISVQDLPTCVFMGVVGASCCWVSSLALAQTFDLSSSAHSATWPLVAVGYGLIALALPESMSKRL